MPIWAQNAEPQNYLDRISNQPDGDLRTVLTLESFEPPDYEIVENLSSKVFIVKFRGTKLGEISDLIVFRDPLLSGVQIQKVDRGEYWVKVRAKHDNLTYKVLPQPKGSKLIKVQFDKPVQAKDQYAGVELVDMLRELAPAKESLILTFDKPVQYDIIRDNTTPGGLVKVRMIGARMTDGLIVPGAPTDMLKGVEVENRGKYLLMVIRPKEYVLKVEKKTLTGPPRVILELTEDKEIPLSKQEILTTKAQVEAEKKNEDEAARQEFVNKKLEEAEQQYRMGRFKKSGLMFKNIYNFAPESEIGVRAAFRSADSYYQWELAQKEPNHEFVVQEYRAAVNAALVADKGYEDVPRAYFNMGRTYLDQKFYTDAFNQFEIILQFYPESPYSSEALFNQGLLHLNMYRYEKSIDTFKRFIKENATAPQVPIALYKTGEAQFQIKRFKEAKDSFDRAWSMNGAYMKTDPELMFHMGEAYFENRDFHTARAIYEQLIDLYPNESFSNLVAIRIGDFLRAEDKVQDAIKAYERAIVKYTKELLLIGKMRIANLKAEMPEKKPYKEALEIYDFITEKHPLSDQVEEAMLRKGLTLALFHHYPDAVVALENFCGKYPENLYVKNRIIHDRILDTITGYITDYYNQGRYLDALGVYEQYERTYFVRPTESKCYVQGQEDEFQIRVEPILDRAPLFLLADSYYRLGLQDKALQIMDQILKDKKDPLASLVMYSKGQILEAKEMPDEAQQVYGDFIVSYPNHTYTPVVKKALGDAYYKVHKFDRVDRAIRIYNQTIRDYQESENPLEREIIPACWFALGNVYQAIGQYDNAIMSYQTALSTYEHPLQDEQVSEYIVDTYFVMGNLFYELNQMPEAMETYEKAIKLFPKSAKTPWAKYQKGQIFVRYNQKDKALKIFEALEAEAKDYPEALWGPLAVESRKAMLNDLQFDKYLNRTPDASLN
ncbi:MAG: tetratricopeptide repeat protein [bacterium]|nr:tetratricopeptide repeat protein [bacterium]